LLGELFIKKQTIPSGYIQQADTSQNKLTNRAVFALVELIVASLLFFEFSFNSTLLILISWIAISVVVVKLLKNKILSFVFFWVGLAAILYLAYFKIFQLLI